MFDPKSQSALFVSLFAFACGSAGDGADLREHAAPEVEASTAALGEHAPEARRALRLPRPTGPFLVGVRSTYVHDASRVDPFTEKPRALPTWIYYPAASARSATPAPYLSPRVQALVEEKLGWPSSTLDVDTGVLASPRPRSTYRGVLLVSGGWATPVAFETALISELASRGWVLVAFDHPHDTVAVEQPEGEPIPGMEIAGDAAFGERVLDVAAVLAALPALVPDLPASAPIAMWGHSMGGAAAVEALRLYPRLVAAVDLDGTPRGAVVELGTDEPVGILSSNAFISQGLEDAILKTLIENLRGPHPIENMYGVGHYGFSDLVVLNPRAARRDPALGALMEATLTTDSQSIDEGDDAIARQRRFLVRFMDRHVARR